MKYHVVSFSGGKDSTAMLLRMLELGYQVDEIVFADTGIEFDEIYRHIEKVEKYIGKKVTTVKDDKGYLYWMFEHEKVRGKNKGKKGYMWMDWRSRWCTTKLKQVPIRKYYKELEKQGYEIIEYHGIALNEENRMTKNNDNKREVRYPLAEWGWTEENALEYCYAKGFEWEGLYKHFNRLSCYMCPLQRLGELEKIWKYFPDKWEHMAELDDRNIRLYNRQFRPDYSINELSRKFQTKYEDEGGTK